MTAPASRIDTSFLDVGQGQLFWLYQSSGTTSDQSSKHSLVVLIHAGVADHTLWDAQVSTLVSAGYDVLRYDIFGFGKSVPNEEFLALEKSQRPKVKHHEHLKRLIETVFKREQRENHQVVLVGISMGASTAVHFTLEYPELVVGTVLVAGAVFGMDGLKELPGELALLEEEEKLRAAKDVEGLAAWNAKYWGDGPLQAQGRAPASITKKLREWCQDIARREFTGEGGFAITQAGVEPDAIHRLGDIETPVALVIGTLDESTVISAMEYLQNKIKNVSRKDFAAAHMVNMEFPGEFNDWLLEWLKAQRL
jgi:3-oxoadipate enol-lactonase